MLGLFFKLLLFFALFIVFLSLVYILLRKFYLSGSKCKKDQLKSIKGKSVLIVGGTSGIGYSCAKFSLKHGASEVIILGSNEKKGEDACEKLKRWKKKLSPQNSGFVTFLKIDLASLNSIQEVCKKIEKDHPGVDVIIMGAAIFTPDGYQKTKERIEKMIGVSFFGHFFLIKYLMDLILRNNARLMFIMGDLSSTPHIIPTLEEVFNKKGKVDMVKDMLGPKTLQILITQALTEKFKEKENCKCGAYTVYPGSYGHGGSCIGNSKVSLKWRIMISIGAFLFKLFGKHEEEICQTFLYVMGEKFENLVPGGFYEECKLGKLDKFFTTEKNYQKAWKLGEDVMKIVKDIN